VPELLAHRKLRHREDCGIRGYLGTGPVAIVSKIPSTDVHFKSNQAKRYYAMLRKHGLQNAFLADAFNSSRGANIEKQQAVFQIQIEIVEPKFMLVMDPGEGLLKS
jgi:hypothetical protein